MRKDAKYNRLTWQRKEKIGNRSPKYIKDIRYRMYLDGYWNEEDLLECAENDTKEIIRNDNRQKENMLITEAISFFKYGRFRERQPYLKELRDGKVEYNGFTFQKDLWCWLVWKETDICTQPQFKGEHLLKVIPDTVPVENIHDVLDAQPWMYI